MSTELLIHNIGYILSGTILISLGFFILIRGIRKTANVLFFLFMLFAALFTLSHLLGVNAGNAELSRAYFMLNACNIFIVVFGAHWALAFLGKEQARRIPLILIYAFGVGEFLFYMIFPDTFMEISEPLAYFPYYYNEGPYYWTMTALFVAIMIYFMFELANSYRLGSPQDRNKLKYLIIGVGFCFIAGLLAALPLYGIFVDPIFSAFLWVGTIPLVYTMVGLDIMNVNIVTKKATIYVLWVVFISVLIVILNSISYVIQQNSSFPIFIIPLLSSALLVIIGRFIWSKIKDAEALKYEFVNIVTHKFRTPLTSIKWSAEALKEIQSVDEARAHAEHVQKAAAQLSELTNILIETSSSESAALDYHREPMDLAALVKSAVASSSTQAEEKQISIIADIPDGTPRVVGDDERVRFIMHVLIDNAVMYSPAGSQVRVSVSTNGAWVSCEVADSGIGIGKADLPHIFQKFYRSARATSADTEGMGLGLFIAKTIIDKLGGQIWAASDGDNKGARVGFKLPVASA